MDLTSGVNSSMMEVACVRPNAKLSRVLFPKTQHITGNLLLFER